MGDQKMSRRDELLLILSSLLLLASTIMLAHSMGVFTGPRGIIGPPVVHSGEHYNLAIVPGLEQHVDVKRTAADLDHAFADVERIFEYKFRSKTRVSVVPYLENPNAVGATSSLFWGTFVEVTLQGNDRDTFRHEMVHVMVRQRNLPLPYAMNEGLAYYFGNPGEWDAIYLAILIRHGPSASLDRPEGIEGTEEYELADLQTLATGWATVFYLHRVKGLSPKQISELKEFPDLNEVWLGIRKLAFEPRRRP